VTTIDLKSAPLSGLLEQLDEQSISEKGLKSLGTALYQCLFVGKINMLFNRSLGETLARADLGLRLRLNIEVPELDILPWELLYSPDQSLFLTASLETPLCRYLSLPTPIRELTCPGQFRILAVIPKTSGLNTAPEKKVLREVERKLGSKIKVDFLRGLATPQAIRDALRDCDYHILHYAGHGLFQHDQAFLILDYDKRSSERVTGDQFAHYFLDYHSIRLVVLNACHGATRSAHQALVGIAPLLVKQGVPAVIAMQDTIRDPDAILFMTEFYSELCHERQGGQVEVAVSRARKALLQSGSQINGFALPVLFLRVQDARLWNVKEPAKIIAPEEKPTRKKSLLERWQVWVGIIGGILAIILGMWEVMDKIPRNETTPLRGIVINMEQEGIAGAIITLEEMPGDTTYTSSNGSFRIEKVPGKIGELVRVYVYKEGYKMRNEYHELPGPARIMLEKQ